MLNIPIYPNFTKFDLSIKDEYLRIYATLQPYCDYSINDLMIWINFYNDLEISFLHDNAILKYSNPFLNKKPTISIVGKSKCSETLEMILGDYSQSHILEGIPEEFIEALDIHHKNSLDVEVDAKNVDYIFNVNENLQLAGKRYENLRHKMNYFEKHYGDRITIKSLQLNDDIAKLHIVNTIHSWDKLYSGKQAIKLSQEGAALNKHLQLADEIEVLAFAIYYDDCPIAFSIYHQPPQSDYIIGNHIKCDYSYKYIFDYTYYNTLRAAQELGALYVNGEQNLDDPGIKKHKEEMIPEKHLRRYAIKI